MQTIAAVVITKDEERNITACLESLKWVDELIVVDAESSDRTVELAKAYTPKVFVRTWPGYGPQKNFAMAQATADWILIVDADERVSDELREEIVNLLRTLPSPLEGEGGGEGETPVAYQVPRRNFYYGRWVKWGGIYPDYQIRLFRRGTARYNDVRIHENLIVNGKIGTLNGHLDHYTEARLDDHFTKFDLYTTLAAQEKSKSRSVVRWFDLAIRPVVTLLKTYLLNQGFRDGIRGLIISVFASMYTFVKYAKLWELTQHADTLSPRDR
jgi:glycosyltransferase involved in cell wall biosynthesis